VPVNRTAELYCRNLPHIVAYERSLFITFKTKHRRRLPPCARNIALARCVHGHGKHYWLHIAVIMPDHVHLILTIPRSNDGLLLRRIMKGIKGTSAREINALFRWRGNIWQDESFDRVVRSDERERVFDYVWRNPVAAGLVTEPEAYPWSWRARQECLAHTVMV